ncbi:DUF6680 family protein [Maritalea mediterranea]|uniref:DUF6680 domain-containing protein n=1 Tax=Maritalea mediterranea TaxID=2909667 RepID=A0ABS9EAR4_9HYPH|nr:DUF6680 family protein [Maritalea mediterranea]MCF4099853.1 hypothetical protein [Maritalea mediterranea]
MTPEQIITTIAIIVGPIAAVVISRWLDEVRDNRKRQIEVFRDLMRTRTAKISPTHVNALNLVEIEFYNNRRVLEIWRKYMKILHTEPFNQSDVDKTFVKLLQSIANAVKMRNLDITDLLDPNYYPRGWNDEENLNFEIRLATLKMLRGETTISVQMSENGNDTDEVESNK